MNITTWSQLIAKRVRESSIFTHLRLLAFKREANALKRRDPTMSRMQARDKTARTHGFNNWHHALQSAKKQWEPFQSPYAMQCTYSRQGLIDINARWVGFNELSNVHLGQSRATQCLHTLVVGNHIGHHLLNSWVAQHQKEKTPWMLWMTEKDWFKLQLKEHMSPLIVHLSVTPLTSASSISLYWSSLDELQVWIDALQLPIASNSANQKLFLRLLRWLWDKSEGIPRTGPSLASYLTLPHLETFSEWSSHPHGVLSMAQEIASWLYQSNPFVHPSKDSVVMSIQDWCSSLHGTILIDDESQGYDTTRKRKIIQAWYRTYLNILRYHASYSIDEYLHCNVNYPLRDVSKRNTISAAWYFLDTNVPDLSSIPSQLRSLGISLTYLYEKKEHVLPMVADNCNTHITQCKEHSDIAILQQFDSDLDIPVIIK